MKFSRICKMTAPFSNNYCRDWLIYHGGIMSLGVFIYCFFTTWPILGIALIIAGLVTGIINFLIDINS